MTLDATPFSALSPEAILNALHSVGIESDGRLHALNSYENRVYQVGMESGLPIVVKFYRPERWSDVMIQEEHAFLAELADAEIPVVPPQSFAGQTLLHHGAFRFAVFPKQGGRPPELEQPQVLEWLGRYIARLHVVGAVRPFIHRPALDIESFGVASSQYLLTHDCIPEPLRDVYQGVVQQAIEGVRRCFMRAGAVDSIRLHGDCHPGNVLWTEGGPHFVDFDDSRMGPAVQDLWMLLSGDRDSITQQFEALMRGYELFRDFDPAEIYLIEGLRTLRLIHYSAWIAQRWADPAFKQAFVWFDTPRYWEERILELREQIALMDEPLLLPRSGNH